MKLGIGMPIVEDVPGEAFGHHIATFVEAAKNYSVGKAEDGSENQVFSITPVGLAPHDTARLKIYQLANEQNCDRLFMMDDDTITPRGGLVELMRTMNETKCVAVSGFYLRRGNPYTSVWTVQASDGKIYQTDADSGVHEIFSSGLGCCLIDLEWCRKNLDGDLFLQKQEAGRTIISDDMSFFENIRNKGGKLLGNANVQCVHVGRRELITRETATDLRKYAQILDDCGLSKPVNA